jgi:hypothetical protein
MVKIAWRYIQSFLFVINQTVKLLEYVSLTRQQRRAKTGPFSFNEIQD